MTYVDYFVSRISSIWAVKKPLIVLSSPRSTTAWLKLLIFRSISAVMYNPPDLAC
jgi:hypothetical protein